MKTAIISGENGDRLLFSPFHPGPLFRTVKEPPHSPTDNGCGPQNSLLGLLVTDRPTLFVSFALPCRNHDFCYGTCKSDKDGCDNQFKTDMVAACDAWYAKEFSQAQKLNGTGFWALGSWLYNNTLRHGVTAIKGVSWLAKKTMELAQLQHVCYWWAEKYRWAVSGRGESAYWESQYNACNCTAKGP